MFLLHVCCADCTIKLLETIRKEGDYKDSEICLYFYNPNIHPRSELLSRQSALKKMYGKDFKIIIGDWSPKEYFEKIGDNEQRPERCKLCWELRLEKTFIYAKENGFEIVSSTLFSSMYQKFGQIKEIGEKLAKKYEIDFWLPGKIDRQKETKGFYKQNYCGCVFSLFERMREKYRNS